MHYRRAFYYLFVIGSLALVGLGCVLTSLLSSVKGTVKSVATEVESGKEILSTGEAIVTKVIGSDEGQTAQAMMTHVAESGAVDTAQAFVTQGIPGLKGTAQALATNVLATPSVLPEDIPIMEGKKSAFVGSERAISYIMEKDFTEILDFYQREMLVEGWTKIEYGSVISEKQAELHFQKDERSVTIVLAQVPFTQNTMVVITVGE